MERRKRTTSNSTKDPSIVWEALELLKEEDWSTEQISADIIPKGTDFSNVTEKFIREIQHKINRRPRKKLNFESPKKAFFDKITNFAVAS